MNNQGKSLFGQTASTGAGSLFGATPSKEGSNTGAFSFGAPTANTGSTGTFSFGAATTQNNKDKPALSFGGSSTSQTAAPSFNFGGANAAAPAADASQPSSGFKFSAAGKNEPTKPALNMGAKPAGGMFGAAPTNASGGMFGVAQKLANDAGATAATPSFSFGAPKADDKPAAAAATPSFSFGAPKADDKPAAAAGPPSFSFGAPKADDKPAAAAPSFSFGAPKADDKPAAASASFSFSAKTDDKPATTGFALGDAKTDTKPAATPSFSFGATNDTQKPTASGGFSLGGATTKKDDKPATAGFSLGGLSTADKKNDTTATTGFSLGGFSAGDKDKVSDKKATPTPGFSLGAKPDEKKESKDAKTVSFSSSVISRDEKNAHTKTVEPQPLSLNNKTLEDLITKWTNQLTKASGSFQSYAEQVKQWDSVLVEGGDKITQLYTDVVSAEQTQSKVEQQLLYVERQQSELETFLDNYEAKAETLLSDVLSSSNQQRDSSVFTNDQKRAQAYRTAELLDENLNSSALNLSSLISEINDVSDSFNKANGLGKDGGSEEEETSLNQIVKLLNTHLDSLKWIEKNSDDLKGKLDQFKGLDL